MHRSKFTYLLVMHYSLCYRQRSIPLDAFRWKPIAICSPSAGTSLVGFRGLRVGFCTIPPRSAAADALARYSVLVVGRSVICNGARGSGIYFFFQPTRSVFSCCRPVPCVPIANSVCPSVPRLIFLFEMQEDIPVERSNEHCAPNGIAKCYRQHTFPQETSNGQRSPKHETD